ncbi:hypothetical protein ACLMJK_002293 [Lecanora helva]
MPSRRSPSLKPIPSHRVPSSKSYLSNRFRYIGLSIACICLYLWHHSSFHLLSLRPPPHAPSLIYKNVDWTRFAYALYATNSAYLCNALMVFSSLAQLGSKADRVLFYPQEWNLEVESSTDRDSQLLVKARDIFGVELVPVEAAIGMKYGAWGLTQYDRVIWLKSDVTVLKHMDGLFLAPRASAALVRAYWELPEERELASSFVLLEPSEVDFQQLAAAARSMAEQEEARDMNLLNRFYKDSAMVLSHREYGMMTEELRVDDHTNFLGNIVEPWDPHKVIKEASLVHFSDNPLPKPWIMWPHKLIGDIMPRCKLGDLGNDDCRNKKIWTELYDDFRKRRKDVCALLSAPAPDWPPRNATSEEE